MLDKTLVDTEKFIVGPDPIDNLRGMGNALFDTICDRPWLGAYFLRNTDVQPNGFRLYERIGQQVLRLGLDPRKSFHAASAVIGFVIGIAADLGQTPPQAYLDGALTREQFTQQYADHWRAMDPAEFPFAHYIADEFAHHDDTDQFRAGFDILLAGLRLQAQA